VTGGTEFKASASHTSSKLAISAANPKVIAPAEARVERDPETGKIVKVIHSSTKMPNPLNDPLASDDDDNEDVEMDDEGREGEGREIIKALEEQASMIPEKRVRKQSQREKEWVERLVGRYGEDYRAMSRDMKLNPMQQTEADIARRVRKWRNEGVVVAS
jgi:nucleolar protein 16